MIVNNLNAHKYIGSAIHFAQRKSEHFRDLDIKNHHSIPLQRAYDKYGKHNLEFRIIEIIEDINQLIPIEQWYLDNWKPEYNVCPTAGGALGRKHSEETKRKISASNKGKKWTQEQREKIRLTRLNPSLEEKLRRIENGKRLAKSRIGCHHSEESKRKISKSNIGKKCSLEAIEKMRLSHLGKKQSPEHLENRMSKLRGRKNTEETKIKIRLAQPASKKIDQYDLNGNFIKSYNSVADAARELNIYRTNIIRHIRNKTKKYKQWIFKYSQ
jgi:group I intron endonuclease